MFSIDGAELSPWLIALLLVCGAVTSAIAGRLADSGWRSATRKDLELYRELSELARNEGERKIAQRLLDTSFRRVDRNTSKAFTAGMGMLAAAAEYPFLIFFAIVLVIAMFGGAFLGNEVDLVSMCFLGCICAGMDIFNRVIRFVASRAKRKDGDAKSCKG